MRRHDPRLIILDLRMPIMDGREFLAAYRQLPGADARVIVCTAGQPGAGSNLDVDEVIAKPFDVEYFLSVVKHFAPLAGRSSFTPRTRQRATERASDVLAGSFEGRKRLGDSEAGSGA